MEKLLLQKRYVAHRIVAIPVTLSDRDGRSPIAQQLTIYTVATKKQPLSMFNKSAAVAEMGDRLATIGMDRKWGGTAVGAGPYWVPI